MDAIPISKREIMEMICLMRGDEVSKEILKHMKAIKNMPSMHK